ncbi:family 16 glycosylhydrolase [Dactylosporangium sp. NPDC049525]|uniref:family 16 glycosylhydrolase n=1 Tax=Dactylosporangium sp. NPDC049525 TaxID=3154730 RepID=UPI0034304D31
MEARRRRRRHRHQPWPASGEIDIMENVGKEPGTVHGTLHGPGYSGGNPLTGSTTLSGGRALADDFHTFAVFAYTTGSTTPPTAGNRITGIGDKWVYVQSSNLANGTPLQLWDCAASTNQRWTFA